MTPVFLDTAGLIAVWDASDQWHADAEAAYRTLVARGCPLVTTSLVLMECGNAAARRPYRRRVPVLRRALIEEGLVFDPSPDELESAWLAFEGGEAGQAGIVDLASFEVMRRLGVREAFTRDRHYLAAEFTTLF